MKNKTKFKLITIIIIFILGITIYFTGTYDYIRIKAINYFENTLNRTGLELIKGTGKLIDESTIKSLEDSKITGEEYKFNEVENAYYKVLENKERKLYKQVYANILEVEKNFKPVVDVQKDEINSAIEAVYNDHPELFWINTDYSYKYINSGRVVQITLSYNSTSKNLDSSKELFNNRVNEIVEVANTYSSFYYKEKYVHDILIKSNVYDENEKLNQSAYSALITGKTVCAGYSRAFQLIMNKLGVRTYYVTGDSSGDHAWNIIELDEEYYNVDVTWDQGNKISYKYFNVPDSIFSKTHTRKDLSIYLPVCRGNKYYNYEVVNKEPKVQQKVVEKEVDPTTSEDNIKEENEEIIDEIYENYNNIKNYSNYNEYKKKKRYYEDYNKETIETEESIDEENEE